LGNGTAQFSAFYRVPKFQLTGFWLEPSNAAAFLFMASFLAWGLYVTVQEKIWMIASGMCCLGGICTFSNGGYFAVGLALLAGYTIKFIRSPKSETLLLILSRAAKYHILMMLSIFLILFSLFGRYIVIKYLPDNIPLKAIAGVRGGLLSPTYTVKPATISDTMVGNQAGDVARPIAAVKPVTINDTMVGRIELVKQIITDRNLYKNIVGEGFRIPGQDDKGRGVVVSASAPMMWLKFTGVIGLIILLLRELQIITFFGNHSSPSTFQLQIFQAWIVLFFQNIAYGTWMAPLYFLLIALVFSSLNRGKDSVPTLSCEE
jgi:hypothetical protein